MPECLKVHFVTLRFICYHYLGCICLDTEFLLVHMVSVAEIVLKVLTGVTGYFENAR